VTGGLDIVIVTNSPGELSSWVRVTVRKLRELARDARLIVMLVPCPYASGREAQIARTFPEVDHVVPPGEFFRFLLGFPLTTYRPAQRGIVVFLGGDLWHALWAAWRLRYRAAAYVVRPSAWAKRFDALCATGAPLKDRLVASGVPEERVHLVGDLMVEGARPTMSLEEARARWSIDGGRPTLGLLPGSRLYHAHESVPVFLKVAEEVKAALPDAQFVLGLSPFISLDDFRGCLKAERNVIPGSRGVLTQQGEELTVRTEGGVDVKVLHRLQYDAMNLSDLVVTIPGTNTAEIAAMARPMIVAATPFAKVPRGGLGGLLGALPLGRGVHVWLLKGVLRRIKYTALPNLLAGRAVVPEIFVEHGAQEITSVALPLLRSAEKRAAMVRELEGLLCKGGAAEALSRAILSLDLSLGSGEKADEIKAEEKNCERMGV